jgi:hypothetical protein
MKKKYTPELEKRFWAKVRVPEGEPENACWLWRGGKNTKGYGKLKIAGNVTDLAHRVAYELRKAPLGKGRVVRQICGEKLCVNPAHLKAVGKSDVKPHKKYDRAAILKDYRAGLKWRELMQKYGISNSGLAKIIKQSKTAQSFDESGDGSGS